MSGNVRLWAVCDVGFVRFLEHQQTRKPLRFNTFCDYE